MNPFRCDTAAARMVLALVVLLGGTLSAAADEVQSKGTVLHGTVTALSGAGIAFEPVYGKGALAIKWEDIQNLTTDGPFRILYGEDKEVIAPLQGLRDGKLTAGTAAIDVATIQSGAPHGAGGPSLNDRIRSAWRYWDGNLDLGFNVQQSTTDTTGFLLKFGTVRTRDPTKLTLGASYRYGTEKKQGEPKSTTQDELLGLIRGDYNFTPRVYGFASGDTTYDGIQRLSIRGVPKLGLGYVFWEQKLDETRRNFLQGEVGPSWVYEKYFGGSDRDYYAVAFGALAGYYLPYSAHLDWRLDYLPAVDNFTTDYLLRTEIGLTVPLIDPVSAKFSLRDEYNNQPAPDAERNNLFLTFGISIGW
ncbi:MAG TPA: DUF481 domain-containing protein [Candidatus Binatia bacterium]|nr:DUF481 domain-containing protein [Candidatus Binatia bacterium]